MSHFTNVKTEIRDMEALENALRSMDLNMEHNAECRHYYGTTIKENVAHLPGPYDVAFEKDVDGTYKISADFYDGHVAKTIGANGAILMGRYTMEKLKKEAKKLGFKVYQKNNSQAKVIDPKEAAGKLDVEIREDGTVSLKASGFIGKKCMKFESLEKALGAIMEIEKTSSYYAENENEKMQVKEWV